jgi:hypothetical protein
VNANKQKRNAARWLGECSGRVNLAFLISVKSEYSPPTHESPRPDNALAIGTKRPYSGRLRDLNPDGARLLVGLHPEGAMSLGTAMGGDWTLVQTDPPKFAELVAALEEDGEIDGVALLVFRNGPPTHDRGTLGDWCAAIRVGIDPLRQAAEKYERR